MFEQATYAAQRHARGDSSRIRFDSRLLKKKQHKYLKMIPWKIQLLQSLSDLDKSARCDICTEKLEDEEELNY